MTYGFFAAAFIIVAQMGDSWPATLTQLGVAGVMLAWFMFRHERKIEGFSESLDIMAKANLLKIVADSEVKDVLREQAQELLKRLEDKAKR